MMQKCSIVSISKDNLYVRMHGLYVAYFKRGEKYSLIKKKQINQINFKVKPLRDHWLDYIYLYVS